MVEVTDYALDFGFFVLLELRRFLDWRWGSARPRSSFSRSDMVYEGWVMDEDEVCVQSYASGRQDEYKERVSSNGLDIEVSAVLVLVQ